MYVHKVNTVHNWGEESSKKSLSKYALPWFVEVSDYSSRCIYDVRLRLVLGVAETSSHAAIVSFPS